MITLQDYLASLISGISEARKTADIASVNTARLYAEHELLKNLPVPRFRVADIELDVPVAIEQVDERTIPAKQPIDNTHFNILTYQLLKKAFDVKTFNQKLSVSLKNYIRSASVDLKQQIKNGKKKSIALTAFSLEIAKKSIADFSTYDKKKYDALKEQKGSNEHITNHVKNMLIRGLHNEINETQQAAIPSQTKLIVEAAKLREIRSENIIRIKLKLHEEGVEWHAMQNEDGETHSKLIPE